MDICNMVRTIGEKIVETSLFGDQNNPPHLSPLLFIQSWGVCCSQEVALKVKNISLRGGGGGVSFIFLFFKLAKSQKRP